MFGLFGDSPLAMKLGHFTGTQCWHQHWLNRFLVTDGIMFLQNEAECGWLVDAIASHQTPALDRTCDGFQLWILRKVGPRCAVLTCQADSNQPALVKQEIEFTDFPLETVHIYVEGTGARKTILLPSEH